ncbi:hypothetical protein ACVXHA_25075 [Escherichia coli]
MIGAPTVSGWFAGEKAGYFAVFILLSAIGWFGRAGGKHCHNRADKKGTLPNVL